jgi:hypothetical protein
MSLDKAQAFSIFSGLNLGQEEAQAAFDALTPAEQQEYEQHATVFVEVAGDVSAKAYFELGQLTAKHHLQLKPEDLTAWTIQDYRDALDAIEGSEFEAIHLANLCRTPATKHLLALVKP